MVTSHKITWSDVDREEASEAGEVVCVTDDMRVV